MGFSSGQFRSAMACIRRSDCRPYLQKRKDGHVASHGCPIQSSVIDIGPALLSLERCRWRRLRSEALIQARVRTPTAASQFERSGMPLRATRRHLGCAHRERCRSARRTLRKLPRFLRCSVQDNSYELFLDLLCEVARSVGRLLPRRAELPEHGSRYCLPTPKTVPQCNPQPARLPTKWRSRTASGPRECLGE
jgi:hypothetical protein